MGRKGVGKLAPFGICHRIEILTAGGKAINGKNAEGKDATGFLTAHLILNRDEILKDEDHNYAPTVGRLDGTVAKKSGTTIILRTFAIRKVPTIKDSLAPSPSALA